MNQLYQFSIHFVLNFGVISPFSSLGFWDFLLCVVFLKNIFTFSPNIFHFFSSSSSFFFLWLFIYLFFFLFLPPICFSSLILSCLFFLTVSSPCKQNFPAFLLFVLNLRFLHFTSPWFLFSFFSTQEARHFKENKQQIHMTALSFYCDSFPFPAHKIVCFIFLRIYTKLFYVWVLHRMLFKKNPKKHLLYKLAEHKLHPFTLFRTLFTCQPLPHTSTLI